MARSYRLWRALETILLSFFRLLYAPNRTREFLAYIYLYRPFSYSERIKCASLSEILPRVDEIPIRLRKCFPEHGNMTGDEIVSICLLIRWCQPNGIFEFGTFNGNTTLQMALNAPENCALYTMNLPLDHGETRLESSAQDKRVHPRFAGSGQAFRDEPERARIQEIFGDSADFDFTPYHGRCNFVLVDAGHEHDYVKADTENALRMLPADGGVIVWHDFPNAPGVCAWLNEFSERCHIYHLKGTRLAFAMIGGTLLARNWQSRVDLP